MISLKNKSYLQKQFHPCLKNYKNSLYPSHTRVLAVKRRNTVSLITLFSINLKRILPCITGEK